MTHIDKILAEFESFDSFFAGLSMEDEENAMKLYEKYVQSFLTSKIAQAEKSGKDRMREALGCICKNLAPASVHFKDCPLGKCHQALTEERERVKKVIDEPMNFDSRTSATLRDEIVKIINHERQRILSSLNKPDKE